MGNHQYVLHPGKETSCGCFPPEPLIQEVGGCHSHEGHEGGAAASANGIGLLYILTT